MSVTTSQAKLGLGSTILRDTTGTGVYVKVADCQNVPEIGEERPLVKVTPSDAAGEIYIGGIPDGMELAFAFNYDSANAQQAAMIADCQANNVVSLRASVPNATTKTFTFNAIHRKWGVNPDKNKEQVLTITVKISGGVTIA